MDPILTGLNVAQRAAVTSPASVLQVLAPPGSGKTKTLTSRVAYLLSHYRYAPWNVICCTFTIKASREMRERLRGLVGCELESKLVLGTFHSICRRYLASYGHLIGIPKNFGIADSDDSLSMIKRAIKQLNLNIEPRATRSRISHRKARGKRLQDLPATAQKSVDGQEFSAIFRAYEEALATSNLLDYDDLLLRCVELLQQHPECVSNVEALLIDEFQDTNVVQFELMKLLASSKRRITIVGDPDQSIYGFRSAEIENLRRMRATYPEAVLINLEENYRSASAVLHLAQEVIEQDNDRPDKKLKATHCYGTLPVLRRLHNPHEEAQWIVSEIKRVTSMTGNLVQHNDIAILLRSAFLSLLIEKALATTGIPYKMVGGKRFFDRVEVRIVLDYLRVISHPDNNSALLSIVNTPARKVGDTTVKELTSIAEKKKLSLWIVIQQILKGQLSIAKKLTKPAEQGLRELISIIQKGHQKMDDDKPEQTPSKLIEYVVARLSFRDFLKQQYREDHEERWENVQELLTQAQDVTLQAIVSEDQLPQVDGIEQAQVKGSQEVLARFLSNVALSTEADNSENSEEKQRITISTIHSAKGLEWPVVFVPAVYEGSIPHSRAEDTNEERRLLYVAITRAQALLYMTFPVTQSRDEGESILTQFLPTKINSRISSVGPRFSDKVIGDIASILRRPGPSQEALAQGVTSLQEHESLLDDVWPADGTRRLIRMKSESEIPSFMLQHGRLMGDALKSTTSFQQRSGYSTGAFQQPRGLIHSSSNQVASSDSLLIPQNLNAPLGFTTANHLRSVPSQAVCQPNSSDSLGMDNELDITKPNLKKATSSNNQGNLSSFFHKGSFDSTKSDQSPGTLPPPLIRSSTVPTKRYRDDAQKTIPPELLKHRPGSLANPLKRPYMVLGDQVANNADLLKTNREHYAFLSSSPTRKNKNEVENKLNRNGCQPLASHTTAFDLDKPEKCNIDSSTTISTSKILKDETNSASSTHLTPKTQFRPYSGMSFANGRLDTLSNPQALSRPPGLDGSTRKTLGVRRSMNGWADRRNK